MNELKEAEKQLKAKSTHEEFGFLADLKAKPALYRFVINEMEIFAEQMVKQVADKRARENQSVKELVRKTFGDGAAEDEDIVSTYADVLNHLVREKIEELLPSDEDIKQMALLTYQEREDDGIEDIGLRDSIELGMKLARASIVIKIGSSDIKEIE